LGYGRLLLHPTYALASAALFGVSTPAAKALLGAIHPGVLASRFATPHTSDSGGVRGAREANFRDDEPWPLVRRGDLAGCGRGHHTAQRGGGALGRGACPALVVPR